MRADARAGQSASNGFSNSSNGSTPRKPVHSPPVNGHSAHILNGSSNSPHTNGSTKRVSPIRPATYLGHDREEVTRILIQGLLDMGYNNAATTLSNESGYELESASVAAFRLAILEGQWSEAEGILIGSQTSDRRQSGGRDVPGDYGEGLILAEGADKGQMLFWIRQQKFLELLEERELSMALMVLRQELTPLHHDIHQLHALSSLLMCPAEDLKAQANWEGSIEESRRALLHDLTRSIAPSVMIRDHRLAELLDQVKRSQINNCLYHNTAASPSLYSDHTCERDNFPLKSTLELEHHSEEVWHLQFSHDGTKLATAGKDRTVLIYSTTSFAILQRLISHDDAVSWVAWSPDDTKLISCSLDQKARVWDVSAGRCILTIDHHSNEATSMTGAAWGADSKTFVTSSLDRKTQLCHWSLTTSDPTKAVHTWEGGYRALGCAITSDGSRLLVIDSIKTLYVYNFRTYDEEYRIPFPCRLTSLAVSRDGGSALVNLAEGEIHLIDLDTGDTVRVYQGQKQNEYVIRSSFGGAAENFVVSGSEDGVVFIWNRETGSLVERLTGSDSERIAVNSIAWNPQDAGMFASAGDDRKVRIWTNRVISSETVAHANGRDTSRYSFARTSALRTTYRGDSNA